MPKPRIQKKRRASSRGNRTDSSRYAKLEKSKDFTPAQKAALREGLQRSAKPLRSVRSVPKTNLRKMSLGELAERANRLQATGNALHRRKASEKDPAKKKKLGKRYDRAKSEWSKTVDVYGEKAADKEAQQVDYGEYHKIPGKQRYRLGVKRGDKTVSVTAKKQSQTERGKTIDARYKSKTQITHAQKQAGFARVGDTAAQMEIHGKKRVIPKK